MVELPTSRHGRELATKWRSLLIITHAGDADAAPARPRTTRDVRVTAMARPALSRASDSDTCHLVDGCHHRAAS
nr:unnamed protein product [Digitaria exilis]